MDGSYRRIQIKTNDSRYKLSYRRGYFTEDARHQQPAQQPDPLGPLMEPGMPAFTQVIYKMRAVRSDAKLSPAEVAGDCTNLKGPLTRYSIDFAISTEDLKFKITPDGMYHGDVEVSLVAYDQDGNRLNWLTRDTVMSLKPELFASFEQGGLQLHQDIDVPKGGIFLRTGVYDSGSHKAGTLEIPLSTAPAAK
jgi:hypothetical protein